MFKCRPGTYDNRQYSISSSLILTAALIALSTSAFADGPTIASMRSDVGRSNAVATDLQTPMTMVWKTTTVPFPKTTQSPLYADGVIYFAMAKKVYAVRAADGTTLWTFSGSAPFNSQPCLSNDALFIGCDDSKLYKIGLKDGGVQWSTPLSAQIRSAIAYANGQVYAGDENGDVYGIDAASGKVVWDTLVGGAVSSPIAMSDDGKLFFAGADSRIYSLSASSGHLDWQLLFQSDLGGTPPCYANGSVYVAAGRDLYSLNPNRGAVRWHARFPGAITTPPTVGPNNVFVATDDNKLEGLNDHGGVLWTVDLEKTCTSAPLLAGKVVLVNTIGGALYAFDAGTGSRVWDYVVQPTGTHSKPETVNIASSPIYVDNTLFALADDGSLSAFRPQTLDQAGPVIYSVTPKAGTTVSAVDLKFGANVVDEGSGVAPSTLTLTVDGAPVTAVAYDPAVNGVRTTVDPLAVPGPNTPALPKLKNGPHTAVLTVADWKGNKVSKTWGFSITDAGAKTAAEQAVEENQTIVANPNDIAPVKPEPNTPTTGGRVGGGPAAPSRNGSQGGPNGTGTTGFNGNGATNRPPQTGGTPGGPAPAPQPPPGTPSAPPPPPI